MFVVISYDIRDDRRRSKIFKVLKNFGQWMQFSVFECELDKANFLRLKDRLDHLIDAEKEDSIRFYFLCEGCKRQIERVGGEKPRKEGAVIV
jgi:CRISPR-associated protein Cas2